MKVLALNSATDGIFKYRSTAQLDRIPDVKYAVVKAGINWIEGVAENPPDAVHICYAGSPEVLAELRALREYSGTPFIVDCDDWFLDVPDYNLAANYIHAASPAFRIRLAMIKDADVVTVSTPTLQQFFKEDLQLDTKLVPNFVNPDWFEVSSLLPKRDKLRILFTGASGGRWGDMEFVKPVMEELAKRDDVSILIFGTFPAWALEYPNIHAIRWVPTDTYFSLMRYLNADIGLAPLLDNPFNRCKSGIKYYEYAMAGVAGVYTDLDPYSEVTHGKTGLVVPNDADAWLDALTTLIESATMRADIARAAKADVQANHTSSDALEKVLKEVVRDSHS